MWKTFISTALKFRFALWAVELVLPSESDLKRRFRSGLSGVLAAVAGGVLAALSAAVLLVGAGVLLYQQTILTAFQAIMVVLITTLLMTLACYYIARWQFEKAFEGLRDRNADKDDKEDILKTLLDGFIEGIIRERPTPPLAEEAQTECAESATSDFREKPYYQAA